MRIQLKCLISVFIASLGFGSIEAQAGSIVYEYWSGISGNTVSSLTADADYPDNPTDTAILSNYFEAPVNWNDNYGARMRGYVHPPVTGNYIFWIASDDYSELWLSTDDKQSNKQLIASVEGYTNSREWTKYSSQQSVAIALEAGRRYYIEALHKDGTQNDNCAVGWQLPGSTYERPIPASRLSPVTDDDDYSLWSDTARITMNTTASGANIYSNVIAFPVCITLDDTNFDFSAALPDGSDIRFAKHDGTHLPFQIEQWDTLTQKASVWVLVDTIFGNDSTQYITMLWGKNDAENRSSGSTVFTNSNGFRGVWHLNQDPSGSAPQITDASGTANHGTSHGSMTSDDLIEGQVAYGLSYDGTNDYISTADQYSNPTVFTLSLWFKTTTATGGKLIGFGDYQAGASTTYDRHIWMDNSGKLHFGIYNSGEIQIGSSAAYNDGNWHQVAAQLSSSGMWLYCDGALVASNSSTTAQNYSGYWRICYDNMASWSNQPGSYYFAGSIDEVVVSHTARGNAWIRLQYANQRTGSMFLNIESSSAKPLVYLTSLIAAVPETSLTSIPYSVTAVRSSATGSAQTIPVTFSYSGTATAGSDYQVLSSTLSLTIAADSTQATVPVSFTPFEDDDDEGDEELIVVIEPDTLYRLGFNDTVTVEITDNDVIFPPVINTLTPENLAVNVGDVGLFSVILDSGSTPLTYTWRKDGAPITDALNSAEYTIPTAAYSDSGALFSCIVTNSAGSDTSRDALLSVSLRPEAPRILRQPLSQTVAEGDSVTLKVVVAGTSPFTFQWYCDTAAIPGATDSTVTVGPFSMDDNQKEYYCSVENAVSSLFSASAVITVRKPSSQTIVITGNLTTVGYDPVGYETETEFNFTVQLYEAASGGSALYTETFHKQDNMAVKVKDGRFALQLGAGKSDDDLVNVVRSHANLFVAFSIARPGGSAETLDRRIPLTASPYALSGLPQLLSGNVNPNSAAISAPIGTHFLNTSNDSTYIRTATQWVILQ